MLTVEVQNWKQVVLDGAGKVLAQREVALSPDISNVRKEVGRFLQYVWKSKGDLKRSLESALQREGNSLEELLKKMNSSRDTDEIRELRVPISIAVALSSYLGQTLETGRTMTVGEFTAEALESEAAKMPASYKEQAETLRRAAQIERELGGNRMIHVWEPPSEDANTV